MSVTISEAVRGLLAGRLRLTEADGTVVDVVSDPAAADAGDWGPPHLDAPYIPQRAGVPVPATNARLGNPYPMKPIVIGDTDLAPE